MLIEIDRSSIRQMKWHEFALRFFLGGGITVVAGLLARKFGPEVGGLFLAFPAIFPAAATLAQKHETQKNQEKGVEQRKRGIDAAGAEAAGAALGSIGLMAFAMVVWTLFDRSYGWITLPVALIVWAVVSSGAWFVRERTNFVANKA